MNTWWDLFEVVAYFALCVAMYPLCQRLADWLLGVERDEHGHAK